MLHVQRDLVSKKKHKESRRKGGRKEGKNERRKKKKELAPKLTPGLYTNEHTPTLTNTYSTHNTTQHRETDRAQHTKCSFIQVSNCFTQYPLGSTETVPGHFWVTFSFINTTFKEYKVGNICWHVI